MSSRRYRTRWLPKSLLKPVGYQCEAEHAADVSSGVAEVYQRQVPSGPGDDAVGAIAGQG